MLVDFIKTADEFIKAGKYNAQRSLPHAETIVPFAALLEINGADGVTSDLADLNKIWDPCNVMCLGSNIQWIFYKKQGAEGYLVKILLNEKDVRINGVNAKQSIYYDWNTLRAFYIEKLAGLHVGLNDDMNNYLLPDLKIRQ